MMIQYLYILQNDHHNKSGQHISPCIITVFFLVMGTFKIYSHNFQLCNTISLPVATMLYITSL